MMEVDLDLHKVGNIVGNGEVHYLVFINTTVI